MSTGEGRKVTFEEIVRVQSMIEQCLMLYMSEKEVIDALCQQQKIEPAFTRTILKSLEEQNQEFFKAYYTRLIIKDQIIKFNNLLKKQAAIMNQLNSGNEVLGSNGSHTPPMHHLQHQAPIVLPPNAFHNPGPSTHTGLQYAYDASSFDYPINMLMGRNPNVGMYQGMNNGTIPVNNESVPLFNMDQNLHHLNRTFSDEFSYYISLNPDNLMDPPFTLEDNQGETKTQTNTPANYNFQNSGSVQQSQITPQSDNNSYIGPNNSMQDANFRE